MLINKNDILVLFYRFNNKNKSLLSLRDSFWDIFFRFKKDKLEDRLPKDYVLKMIVWPFIKIYYNYN